MKRKLVKQGVNALTVSLPAKWVKKNNLKAGEEIDVEEKKEGLVLRSSSFGIEPIKVNVNVSGPSKLIRRYIGNLYRKGYDEMRFEFDNPSYIKEIQKHIIGFLGLEITQQGSNYCVVRNVASVKDEEFDNMMNRMFLLTLTMGEDLLEGIKEEDFDKISNISILELTHNKLFNFCLRIINRPTFRGNVYFTGMLLIRLEDAGDRYRDIAEYIIATKHIKLSKPLISLLEEANKKLKKVYELYSKFDGSKAVHIQDKKKELTDKALQLLENVSEKEVRIAHILSNLIDDVYEAASPIFGLHL